MYLPARKDFGFVRFSSEEEAHGAADMQGLAIHGMELSLELAVGSKKGSAELAAEKGPPKGKGYGKDGILASTCNCQSFGTQGCPTKATGKQRG